MRKKAYLILENKEVFEGEMFGYDSEVIGEVVFTTGMTGYLETLTDPSYFGQIVVQTFPMIGNYGVIPSDFESPKPFLKAYIVRELCDEYSNFRADYGLEEYLKAQKITGLCGVDTREITRIVREHGVLNGKISYTPDFDDEIANFTITDAVNSASCTKPEIYKPTDCDIKHNVVLWDFGSKRNICRELLKRNCTVTVVPASYSAAQIMEMKPDGVMLSNGPGDPSENTEIIKQIRILQDSGIPIFGICLGHQLMALAQDAKTVKLKYGHRGLNQPVIDVETERVYITSQNHGYAVVSETLPSTAHVSFINANDKTCEGVDYDNIPAFSVQFHPEACAGPNDASFLFDRFIGMM